MGMKRWNVDLITIQLTPMFGLNLNKVEWNEY